MSIQTRRERERADRERLIIETARDLAESEGWDAVTTRRLAQEIEYSQPVLYSHFNGKTAIMTAVAVEGCTILTALLRTARASASTPRDVLSAVGTAYADFAEERPALYDAMFTHAVDLPFATAEAPLPLQEAFGELREAIRPLAGADDLDVLTETWWAGLHGLVTLMRDGRLLREHQQLRLATMIGRFAEIPGSGKDQA
ncbi:TetR/AcrR family transcriptional regulator [Nonomuraea sp. NBC_01738]|uniref:TetR/AcrR family transcriptional regulator n=1 Tax=Nonomuraea sp. NBC_01738 TaxID=2976003 RepID=UPI002E144463|nr:TetR/AcrR family transcriptional regulator [Nonomuraea sp. NBC_01738]